MKLSKLSVESYRSLRGESIAFSNFNLFIGANASGKSTILKALNFFARRNSVARIQDACFS